MPTLRWTGDNLFSDLGRTGKMLSPGDEITVADEDLPEYLEHRCGDDFEVINGDTDATDDEKSDEDETESEESSQITEEDEPDSESETDAEAEVDLEDVLENNVGDLEEELSGGEYDDHLEELLELEEGGDDRTTAKTAINSRMDDVQE